MLSTQRIRHRLKIFFWDNGVLKYGWTEADGRTFGRQKIDDDPLELEIDWLNNGHSWSARIRTTSIIDSYYAFIFYFTLQVILLI